MVKEIFKLKCEDINYTGLGVGRHEGFLVFVPGLVIGDEALVEVVERKKNYGIGRLIKIIEPSPHRINAPCCNEEECGGCTLLNLDYGEQLNLKMRMATEALRRIGCLDITINKIIGMNNPVHFRNKVQFTFAVKNGHIICGYYKPQTNDVFPVRRCLTGPADAGDIAAFMCELAEAYGIEVYNADSERGQLRSLIIRVNHKDKYMMALITRDGIIPRIEEIIQKLHSKFPNIVTITQIINKNKANILKNAKVKVLSGTGILTDRLMGLNFNISSLSFFQTNRIQTEKLYQEILNFCKPKPEYTVVDAYSGVGTIALLFAPYCRWVIAIEEMALAVKDAKRNSILNGAENIKFLLGKAENEIGKIDANIDALIIDPPRRGCDKDFLDAVRKRGIKRIIYVSCNITTLARDLAYLGEDYKVSAITLVDMFPHTMNVESVVLICKSADAGKC